MAVVPAVLEEVAWARASGLPRRRGLAVSVAPALNEYCLFLKPWITAPDVHLERVLELITARFVARGLHVDEVMAFPGQFLSSTRLMEQHYGTLADLARKAEEVSPKHRAMLAELSGDDVAAAPLVGGFQFLERMPSVTPFALEIIWENIEHHRLAAGVYCGRVKVTGQPLLLVNGFVPNLLRAYTDPGRVVIVFTIRGDLGWSAARRDFVGAADPAAALRGSLRRELFERQSELGIRGLRLGANGVHFSAGPLEAAVELRRFRAAACGASPDAVPAPQFLTRLIRAFPDCDPDLWLANPTIDVKDGSTSLFELTEECDEPDALARLALVRDRLTLVSRL